MVVIVANYLEIKNDNNIVVINDQYPLPCLIYRGTFTATDEYADQPGLSVFRFYSWNRFYSRVIRTATKPNDLRSLGFDLDFSDDNVNYIKRVLTGFYRTETGQGCFCVIKLAPVSNNKDNPYELIFEFQSNTKNTVGEMAVYCLDPKILFTTGMGGHFKNASGDIVFDFMRGPMQIIGTMSGGVNTYNDPAATYNLPIPSGLNEKNVFISAKSMLPFHSAYRLGNTITQYATLYEPRMTFTPGNLKVELRRQSPINGSNSVYSFGGFFENVAYIVQPQGWYI